MAESKSGGQHEVYLMNTAQDAILNPAGLKDGEIRDALLEIVDGDQLIIVQQRKPGKTIAEPGAKASIVKII